MFDVDAAFGVDFAAQSGGIVQLASADALLIAIFDGRGTWGNGHEAANWLRQTLEQRWKAKLPVTADELGDGIFAAAESVPADLRDTEFGCAACGVAVLAVGSLVEVVAAGTFECWDVSRTGIRHVYRCPRLLEQLVTEGQATAEEVERMGLADLPTGPFLADGTGRRPLLRGPLTVEDGHVLALAHRSLLPILGREDPTWLVEATAAEWQSRDEGGSPVVLLRPTPAT